MLLRSPKTESSPDPSDAQFQLILKQYGSWLRGTVRRLCSGGLGIQPEDIEQDVAVRLWQALRSRPVIENPAAFLYRLATTATIDAMRRVQAQRKGVTSSLQGGDSETPADLPATIDSAPTPERTASDRQTLTRVSRALEGLPENRRVAVKLYLQGFKIQEIADLSGWTEPKARNLLYRGLQAVRSELEAAGFEYWEPQ
ncbi:MAG: RNA polymerase sigma factor [Acidobacteriota bacterium]